MKTDENLERKMYEESFSYSELERHRNAILKCKQEKKIKNLNKQIEEMKKTQ